MSAKKILFLYPDPPGFSGQRVASEMTLEAIQQDERFSCVPIKLPGLPKTGNIALGLVAFFFKTFVALTKFGLFCVFRKWDGLFVAVSQTTKTLSREDWLIRFFKRFNEQAAVIYRLDSSSFTRWSEEDAEAGLFRKVIGHADVVSTLGPTQDRIMKERYADSTTTQVVIAQNTTAIDCISESDLLKKHVAKDSIEILHLSSLMEPKGYCDILDAVPEIAPEYNVTICGRLTRSPYDRRFISIEDQKKHIVDQSRKFENVVWVNGAFGVEKEKLFAGADIFVMPTWYPVEAQPLVLIEAMASGAAIIASQIGEIPGMATEENAVILEELSATSIANAINKLAKDHELRLKLARKSCEIFHDKFGLVEHDDRWRSIFANQLGDRNFANGK